MLIENIGPKGPEDCVRSKAPATRSGKLSLAVEKTPSLTTSVLKRRPGDKPVELPGPLRRPEVREKPGVEAFRRFRTRTRGFSTVFSMIFVDFQLIFIDFQLIFIDFP